MSDSRLPENLGQWPQDPFALLGVNQASNRREVKRAYAQLIRVFKPEHFPEHFRRLRDAYELLDQRLAWMESNGLEEAGSHREGTRQEARSTEKGEESSEQGAGRAAVAPNSPLPAPCSPLPAPPCDLWQKARQGDLAEAYKHFSQLARSGRGDEELFVRLFWMRRLTPEIEPALDPRDWLLAGIKQFGLRGRLPEIYRCELLDDPSEALSSRCEAVLLCSGHLGLLTELVIARWGGAARLRQWEAIGADLKAFRGRMQDEPAAWGRLLLAAIDQLAWAPQGRNHETFLACLAEVEEVAEHSLAIAAELNQRDNLGDLVQACEKLKSVNLPLEWRKSLRLLLSHSWNEPLEKYRHRLLGVLAPLVQNPILGLEWLDKLETQCSPAFHRLGTLIVMLANECRIGTDVRPHEDLRARLIEFLIANSKGHYPERWSRWIRSAHQRDRSGRLELLMFCLQENLTMQQMCDLLASGVREDLAKFLAPAGSASLHFICLAYQAFWA
jgi:hypothetical protein